ncbi:MAG: hypothetical protein NVS2B9_05330 [Myxococcales bacterium]
MSDAGVLPVEAPRPGGGDDWLQYRHDPGGASMNPGTFTAAAAAEIGAAPLWTAELGEYVYTQAMITAESVFFTTAVTGKVVALDTATGRETWHATLNGPITTKCHGAESPGFWSSVGVLDDTVYAPAPDGNLYALARSSGAVRWSTRIADPTAAGHGEFVQSSPAISKVLGKLYLGVASSAGCDTIPGRVLSVDLATHAVTVRQLLAPGRRGAGVWSSLSIDEAANRVYATSGEALEGLAAEPLAQALIAFDAQTLEVVDHWQNPSTVDDDDFGSSPTLFAAADGTPLVAAASKGGTLFVLRRGNLAAGPVWKYQIASPDQPTPGTIGDPVFGWGSLVSPTFANGVLYAAGGRTSAGAAGAVVAFEPGTGRILWQHTPPGYVIAPMAAVGDVLVVESSLGFKSSTLEVLDARNGAVLRTFPGASAVFGGPSVGRGLVVWSTSAGHVSALAVPAYRH